ncbi:MAG: T9SS type A sorting domain-containing protein [Bacteroidetes bacterium]|nr:T9SS type A sorting domain-containing protein [Bacteroidota bacterium]
MLRTVLQIFFIILLFTGPLSVKSQIIVDENTPYSSLVTGIGPSLIYNYFTQSFIADVFVITKFGMWLKMGAPNGGVTISVCPADGSGNPDLSQILHESSLILPSSVGAWYYEDSLSIDIDSGKKYFLLADGYNNSGASGYSSVGWSTTFTSTGEGMRYTQDNTNWNVWSNPLCIYVEGSLCKFARINGLDPWYCASNDSIVLTGSPLGGIMSGPGVSGSVFNSSLAGVGTHDIIYSYTDGNCTDMDTQQVIVYASPAADFTYTVNGPIVDFTDNSILAANWVWDFSDGYISTLQNVTHFFLYGGIYDVKLIVKEDSLICEDNVTKQIDMTHLGIDDPHSTAARIQIYPNPVLDELMLKGILPIAKHIELTILNSIGQVVQSSTMDITSAGSFAKTLSINELPPGIYYLQFGLDEEIIIKKFVKE